MDRMKGKVALITGGSGGIGAAIGRLFTAEGARVTLLDVSLDGPAVARDIGCRFRRLDVGDELQWAEAIREIVADEGGIDVLVNAAAIEGDLTQGTLETTSLAEWRRVHAINLDGTFLGCRAVFPVMKRKGRGSIVNICSIVSKFASPQTLAYGSSKAAIQQLSKSVALQGSRDGARIRCNSVHPGITRTPMLAHVLDAFGRQFEVAPSNMLAAMLKNIPLDRVAEPEDVANLVLFLASDEASYITGSEFEIDAGWHLADAR